MEQSKEPFYLASTLDFVVEISSILIGRTSVFAVKNLILDNNKQDTPPVTLPLSLTDIEFLGKVKESDACTFHTHLGCIVFMQHVNQSFQVRSQHSNLVLKQNTVFVENAHKNAIYLCTSSPRAAMLLFIMSIMTASRVRSSLVNSPICIPKLSNINIL